MKFSDRTLTRYALSCVAAAMLAGCGGSQPPIGAPGATPQTSSFATHADRGKSWMLPEAKSEDLLYVSTLVGAKVYSYPRGKRIGRPLKAAANAPECVDKAGDLFVGNRDRGLTEYKHGGDKPMKTFSQSGYGSGGCGSDTTTGNLAVPFGTFDGSEAVGFVAVYQNASGNPAIYNLNGMAPNYCGYDNKGDLFCDGVTAYGDQFLFAELPKGGNALESIALNQSIGFGGLVQWDGRYITVVDVNVNKVYGFIISSSSGTLRRTVTLQLPSSKFFDYCPTVFGKTVIEPNIAKINDRPIGVVNYFHYPAGGTPFKTLKVGDDTAPFCAVVSVAPSQSPIRKQKGSRR